MVDCKAVVVDCNSTKPVGSPGLERVETKTRTGVTVTVLVVVVVHTFFGTAFLFGMVLVSSLLYTTASPCYPCNRCELIYCKCCIDGSYCFQY